MLIYPTVFVSTHVTMGALIGQNSASPWLAFLLGVASHFILDLVPHGDSRLYHSYKAGNSLARSIIYTAVDSVAAVGVFVHCGAWAWGFGDDAAGAIGFEARVRIGPDRETSSLDVFLVVGGGCEAIALP